MRYGLVSDVHANLPALDAALRFLSSEGVDAYLCAGDLVGYGPDPDPCVERVLSLPGRCVAGNHDLIAIGALPPDRCDSVVARESLAWTSRVLAPSTREALEALPRTVETEDGVVVMHGSLDDPEEYVRTPARAAMELAAARARTASVRVLIAGHTHLALAADDAGQALLADDVGRVDLPAGGPLFANAGAVGQSREEALHARVAVLDLGAGTVTFHALGYDPAGVRARLRRHRLSRSSIHVRPRGRWRAAAGRARRKVLPRPPR